MGVRRSFAGAQTPNPLITNPQPLILAHLDEYTVTGNFILPIGVL
jgi:hypothetical protein